MAAPQDNPAYPTNEPVNPVNPANPIIPGDEGVSDTATNPKGKLSFTERHFTKAPTTKDVESNRWVFGEQQEVAGPRRNGHETGDPVVDEDVAGARTERERGMEWETEGGAMGNRYEAGGREPGKYAEDMGDNVAANEYRIGAPRGDESRYVGGDGDGLTGTAGGGAGVVDEPVVGGDQGPRDDGVTEEEHHKKKNPLKKIVEAIKNV